jgi:ABC-type sugar transport system substrate-binding protein
VDQSTGQLGETAAKLALELIDKKPDEPKTILLTPTLVVRESTIGKAAGLDGLPKVVSGMKKAKSAK